MNQTFTQHVVMPRHTLRSESEDAGKHRNKQRTSNLIYSVLFCCKMLLFGILIQGVSFQQTFAQATQNVVVKGTVVDDSDGQGVPGITISDNARKVYGVTSMNGAYTVTVPNGTVLNFTMIGYTTVSRTINGGQNNLVIRMKESSNLLNEVVVTTALGIKRSERALGYATTTLDSNSFTDAVATNWTDALSGKVAGLNLVRNSGPSGSNKIILRGENNLTNDNEALIVIDGVVASSSSRRTGSASAGAYNTAGDILPTDYGRALNDLNPDDIENVTVLKGPGASALYGQRGANGAIIITTKSANKNKKRLSITFTSNTAWEQINNNSPDIQNEYGQGVDGAAFFSWNASVDGPSTRSTSSTWGPRIDPNSLFIQYDPALKGQATTRTPWVGYANPITGFFKTGVETNNSVSLDGTIKNVGLRFSASHAKNDWIAPNTGLERTSASLSAVTNLTKNLNIVVKAAYNNRNSDNLPATGYGNQSLMYWFMFSHPNVNIDWYRDYWVTGQEQRKFVDITSTNPESPYAISEQYINGQKRNGILSSVQATYKFTKDLSLMVRSSIDYNHDFRNTRRPFDAAGLKFAQGSYREQKINSYEINADFLLNYKKSLTSNLSLSVSAGGSQMKNRYYKSESRADGLVIPGVFRLDNNANPLISVPDTARYNINSFYGLASLSFKSYLYLDITARQDWNSTLASPLRTSDVGFFYPSASLSFIASDFWKMPKAVNYLKLRGSVAQVGSGGKDPYRTAYNYILASNGIYPGDAMTNPNVLPNYNLKPLKTTTFEVGIDVKLFKSRLNFDIAAYKGSTKNQILRRSIDPASGYSTAIFNAGRVDNKGIEMSLNAIPVQTKSFKWTLNGTFTANRNEIKELADSSVVLSLAGLTTTGAQIVANVGGSLGDIYGFGVLRAPDGQVIYNSNNGLAINDGTTLRYLGNTTPKFRFSFGTGLTYKKISLNVLFDAQLGAVAHSLTFTRMASLGKLKLTLPGRYGGLIGQGYMMDPNSASKTLSPNTAVANDVDGFYDALYGSLNAEGSIFRTDYLKFREANLNFAFSQKLVARLGLSRLSLGVYGRNLFVWTPWPAFDPEFGTLAGNDIVQGFETGQLPATRSYGVRLVVGIN
jgi:TonB-linked SusC/RagA family outer membrane protein